MYHISKNAKNSRKKRWVLLEQLPTILSPKVLLLLFLYAMAFTLFLLGLRILRFENALSDTADTIVSAQAASPASIVYRTQSAGALQRGIASHVIRLHVVANSDTDADQSLKLTVRDAIVRDLQSSLSAAPSVQTARSTILSQIPAVQKKAEETITAQGFDYPVHVTLGTRYFPVKTYGDLRFPAGNYEALCVQIGAAEGHNWWCVLFPSLCFVDETHAVVPKESKKKLRQSLSAEEYESLEIHSAVYDWLSHHKHTSAKKTHAAKTRRFSERRSAINTVRKKHSGAEDKKAGRFTE